MLAYSSISNAGMGMAAVAIGTQQSMTALFLYWTLFTITNFGSFGMLWLNRGKNIMIMNHHMHLENFLDFAQISPFTASIIGLFLFSLTGLPPFALFWENVFSCICC